MPPSSLPVMLRSDAELQMGASWPKEAASLCRFVTAPDDEVKTLVRLAPEATLLFTCYAPISSEVIAAGEQLRGIVKYGVGVDSIDLKAAAKRGIPVVHCPEYGTDTVADHAFALLMSVARKITHIDRGMQAQGWLWPEPEYCGVDLAGKTIGLLGFGRIGKAMARRTQGFGMRCLVYDPYVAQGGCDAEHVTFAPLDRVLEEADFVSLHCVLTPETRGIIDASALRRMKDSALLVNVSRGALIDQQALIQALEQEQIAGAGLDVFVKEPLDKSHPLHQLSNVILTPHLAFYTQEAYERLEQQCFIATRELLAGRLPGPPLFVKNGEALREYGNCKHAQYSGPGANARTADNAAKSETWQVSEGDVNLSPHRVAWQSNHLNATERELLDRDAAVFLHQALSTPCLTTLSESKGSYLSDTQGRRYLDFHGNSAHQIGYRHPKVLEAIEQQLTLLPFSPRRFTNEPAVALAEKLAALAPGRLGKVLFAPGGSLAIGMAMKLARYATGRHKTISMWDSFHGASLDAISIGGEAIFRDRMGPLLPGCFHVPWPYEADDADAIEKILQEQGDIGAIIAEPMRCTTIVRPPIAYWQRVRELCDEYGALLIFDEIPLAFGRTGRMFCCEHLDVTPDILVVGKGLGGGVIPMAAILARDDLDLAADYALGHYTHEKNPLGASAGLAMIEVIESEGLLQRATELGERTLQSLGDLRLPSGLKTEVRGLGLALGVELQSTAGNPEDLAQQVLYRCLSKGLSFKISGGNVLTLTPPLTITDDEMDEALRILQTVLQAVVV